MHLLILCEELFLYIKCYTHGDRANVLCQPTKQPDTFATYTNEEFISLNIINTLLILCE
jgi:hypothetical protein